LLGAALVLIAGAPAHAQAPIEYRLRYAEAGGALVHVSIALPAPADSPRTLVMPRAVPMGYGQQPYDRFVSNVAAFSAKGEALPVTREDDAPRWRVGRAARVEYDVDLARMEREIKSAADASKVRPAYAGILGYSVFAFLEGEEERPIRLVVEPPTDWPVLSTLAPEGGELRASNFYALADSQIAMGPKLRVQRIPYAGQAQAPLYLMLYAEGPADAEQIARLAGEAMEKIIAYFGSAPFPHYTVHMELLAPISPEYQHSFSMEHLDSASFYLGKEEGPLAEGRTRYNFAHHFAHAWIPKRCYGEGYFPFSWELAPLIDTIWFSEGFAQYVAIAALAMSEEERQEMLERRFRSTLREAPAFLRRMPLRDLSLIASSRYGADFRTGSNSFSRGGLMAAEMDDRIRERTGGDKSLRDALRYLVEWSRKNQRAFRIEELPVRFREATGVETQDILERWLKPLN
jgi:predicted metalloprotease with PDZ domain